MAGHLAFAPRRIIPMAICRNPNCPRAYQNHDGIVVVDLVRVLRASHDAGRATAPANIQGLIQLAPQIYQAGPHCVSCGQPVASLPGPSSGADKEVDLARKLGIPVFAKIDELTKHFNESRPAEWGRP